MGSSGSPDTINGEALQSSQTSVGRGLQFFLHPEESWTLGTVEEEHRDKSGATVWEYRSCEEDGTTTGLSAMVRDPNIQCAPVVAGSLRFVPDLLALPYLHDSVLLQHVRQNYAQDLIYTNIGPIVLALNPYNFGIPHYQDVHMPHYIEEGPTVLTAPSRQRTHVWSVAHEAYWAMMERDRPQSVLVSGESGAGKTEAAKMVIKYLAACSTHWAGDSAKASASSVIQKIVQCSPILEAFGNAKTVRNDNSSRFGKFMKLQFTTDGLLCGAFTYNYLLEKSRVVSHGQGERCYHSFYQLLAGASEAERERYGLQDPAKFAWLFKGNPPSDAERVEDARMYQEVREAMDVLGLTTDEQDAVYRVIAGILHFQTIDFSEDRDGCAVLIANGLEVVRAAALMWQVDADGLLKEITEQKTALYTRPLKKDQALDARDGISKVLYKEMFEWLIGRMNALLHREPGKPCRWLGLLDIFGFENFETNSFEQLCINYANENLQNHYNSVVFARDLEEYQAEGIEMSFINPPDNRPCLDLLDSKEKMGLFTLLDDQAKAQGSDANFLEAIRDRHYQRRREHPNLTLPRINDHTFTIRHYAADVQYSVRGFQAKNMDPLADGVRALFTASRCALVRALLPEPEEAKAKGKKLRTVCGFFKDSMAELMDTILQTSPFWIRCVKPHHAKKPRMFQGNEVMAQLRSAGVLETVKIRQCGYPWRLPHGQFWATFKVLLDDHLHRASDRPAERSAAVLAAVGFAGAEAQVGRTKVFLKEAPYTRLETLRTERMRAHAVAVQQWARAKASQRVRLCHQMEADARRVQTFALSVVSQHVMRRKEEERHQRRCHAALQLQRHCRAVLAQRRCRALRVQRAISAVQAAARTALAKQRCQQLVVQVRSAVVLQSAARTWLAARGAQERRRQQAALLLQRFARCRLADAQRETHAAARRQRAAALAAFLARGGRHPACVARLQAAMRARWASSVVEARRQRQAVMEADMFLLGLSQDDSEEEWTPPTQLATRDPQLLRQYVGTLAKELHAKRRECSALKRRLEEESARRSELEGQLVSFGAGLGRPPVPPSTDLATLQQQVNAKTEEVFNARLLVRHREEELILLKKAVQVHGPEDPARAELVRQIQRAVQPCQASEELCVPASQPWDGAELLEPLRDAMKNVGANEGEPTTPLAVLLRRCYDTVLAVQRALQQSDAALFVGPSVQGSCLGEALGDVAEAARLQREVDCLSKANACRKADPLEPLDAGDDAALQEKVAAIQATIHALRETARRAVKLQPRDAQRSDLLSRLRDLQQKREKLQEDQALVAKIRKDFEDRQDQREVELAREIGRVTDTVATQRQALSARRKALEEDVATLMRWEVHKAKVYSEYQTVLATRADVETLLDPVARALQVRMEALIMAGTVLAHQRAFVEEVQQLTQRAAADAKAAVYRQLGAAHTELWAVCKARWLALEAALGGTTENAGPGSERMALIEPHDTPAFCQRQFECIVECLQSSRTFSFLSNDPSLKATVADNFLARDSWRRTLQPVDDLR